MQQESYEEDAELQRGDMPDKKNITNHEYINRRKWERELETKTDCCSRIRRCGIYTWKQVVSLSHVLQQLIIIFSAVGSAIAVAKSGYDLDAALVYGSSVGIVIYAILFMLHYCAYVKASFIDEEVATIVPDEFHNATITRFFILLILFILACCAIGVMRERCPKEGHCDLYGIYITTAPPHSL